jgi:hypothetical protein
LRLFAYHLMKQRKLDSLHYLDESGDYTQAGSFCNKRMLRIAESITAFLCLVVVANGTLFVQLRYIQASQAFQNPGEAQ